MMEWVDSLAYWHWLSLGFALIAAELLISAGFFLLFIGIGALLTGVVVLLAPEMAWQFQMVIFGTTSAAALVGWWKFGREVVSDDHPNLNLRGAQYVGRVYTLEQAIVNGAGWCPVGDSRWNVRGPDLAAGTRIKVVVAESNVLIVEEA
jgi:membrane protein implicated in regulation of membrane protease activity